jgi:copper chaperone
MEADMVVVRVPDMDCDGCARAVRAALRAEQPRAKVEVDVRRREASVAAPADAGALARVLRTAGFPRETLAA